MFKNYGLMISKILAASVSFTMRHPVFAKVQAEPIAPNIDVTAIENAVRRGRGKVRARRANLHAVRARHLFMREAVIAEHRAAGRHADGPRRPAARCARLTGSDL